MHLSEFSTKISFTSVLCTLPVITRVLDAMIDLPDFIVGSVLLPDWYYAQSEDLCFTVHLLK